jgi:outer membrane protein OmpA-like peptidoglycan-associated protein
MIVAPLLWMLCACAAMPQRQPRYVVFFEPWSSRIDAPARAVIGEAAAWAKAHPEQVVQVRGYADPEGSLAATTAISGLRARVISDLLEADGVRAARIRPITEGSVPFSGDDALESRRVEVVFRSP